MELSFQQRAFHVVRPGWSCFNPCFNGTIISTQNIRDEGATVTSFNPCFKGTIISTTGMSAGC